MVGAVQVHLRKLSKSVLILLYGFQCGIIKVPNLLSMAEFFHCHMERRQIFSML